MPVLREQESWGDAAQAVMSLVEAVPFCHHNICFNMLCFFPDWNHLNCIYQGLYRQDNKPSDTTEGLLCFVTVWPVRKRAHRKLLGLRFSKGVPPSLPPSHCILVLGGQT